jgi:hypothetical protein
MVNRASIAREGRNQVIATDHWRNISGDILR